MSTPTNKFPLQEPTGDPKVDAAENDVITNTDETQKVTNKDGAVADMDGIESALRESEPSTVVPFDPDMVKSEDGESENPIVN